MRLIDADEIRKKAVPHTRGDMGRYNANIRKWAVLVGDIDNAPTVDAVEVVHGRWEEWWPGISLIMTGEEMLYRCSVCGAKYPDVEGYKYCPNCGTKMDGERKDNGET